MPTFQPDAFVAAFVAELTHSWWVVIATGVCVIVGAVLRGPHD